jgi:hypothetical protein
VGAFNLRVIQWLDETIRPIGEPEWLRWIIRVTCTGRVPDDHSEVASQLFELWPPRPRIEEKAVQENERRTTTRPLIRNRKAIYVGAEHFESCVAASVCRCRSGTCASWNGKRRQCNDRAVCAMSGSAQYLAASATSARASARAR